MTTAQLSPLVDWKAQVHWEFLPEYNDWQYLYPARPNSAITPEQFEFWEKRGYLTQVKLDGDCAIIGLGPDGRLELWNRHAERLRWVMPAQVQAELRRWYNPNLWQVIVAEFLNTGGLKDTIFIHDQLVLDGRFLRGVRYADRHDAVLRRACGLDRVEPPADPVRSRVEYEGLMPSLAPSPDILFYDEKIWVALNRRGDTRILFDSIGTSRAAMTKFAIGMKSIDLWKYTEGIVLKNPEGRLETCDKETANGKTMLKCRRRTKNYSH